MTNLENYNGDKTQSGQNGDMLKQWLNSNCDESQTLTKLNTWQSL